MNNTHQPEELAAVLKRRIDEAGGIPFAEFMEEALYHPRLGYYTTPRTRIGKQGDFFTSSSVHACFGRLVACQVEQMGRLLADVSPFTLAEQGAGEGHLALDILDALEQESPAFYQRLAYRIVELSADNRRRQAELLERHVDAGRVEWCRLENLKGMQGCLLSNELVDSFPVHLVEKHGTDLREVYVINTPDGFGEDLRTLSDPRIAEYFALVGHAPAEGTRCEVNLRAWEWMRQVAEVLKRGFVLTVDYGYPAEELRAPFRQSGTLLCYHQHQIVEDPYRRVGEQDMTAHVDFSLLQEVGRRRGLDSLYFGQQYQFLMGLGFVEMLCRLQAAEKDPDKAQALRLTLKNLILPEGGMGEQFKVLIQGKHVGRPDLVCARKIRDIQLPEGGF